MINLILPITVQQAYDGITHALASSSLVPCAPKETMTYLLHCRNRLLRDWYVSVVSIIFDCFMPILYNFHIFLATLYMIYWTNLLIQCPVPVPVCCMFFVSQRIHIKQTSNAIKIYGDLFWNLCDFWEVESTQTGAHKAHNPPGRARHPVARPGDLRPPRRSVGALLLAQKRLRKKIV